MHYKQCPTKYILSSVKNLCLNTIHLKVPDNLSHFSRHDLAYFEARPSIFLLQSFNSGCDSPGGIQIKIQIGKISELDSNLNCLQYTSTNGTAFLLSSSDKLHPLSQSYQPGKQTHETDNITSSSRAGGNNNLMVNGP